jgi:hypothetical protein
MSPAILIRVKKLKGKFKKGGLKKFSPTKAFSTVPFLANLVW